MLFFCREEDTGGELVETDGHSLAEVHRGLRRVGWNFNEYVAIGKVFAGEAVFFWTKEDGDPATASDFLLNQRRQGRQRDDRLLGLAVGKSPGAEHECAGRDCFGERLRFFGVLE